MVTKADLDWPNLSFGYMETDHNVRCTWRDGEWSRPELSDDFNLTMSAAATCLHYGQEAFEGLKVFTSPSGSAQVFRIDENAKRMRASAERILMAPVPEDLFVQCVDRCVQANLRFVPPHGSGAALYVRPLLIGTGPQVGVKPADEYLFLVLVMPVGPYFKTGFKPVDLIVEDEWDRAAPNGVGDVKVGGNYAAGMRASQRAKAADFTEVLYLDARHKRYIDESGPANFFGITPDGKYITPESGSILPSITNMSLRTLAADHGLEVERRPVDIEEIFGFQEAGCCGTAAVITPVRRIVYKDREAMYCPDGEPGPRCVELYEHLKGIQEGDREDPYDWVREIPAD